ncbi:NAD(P)/FAD-dependent oxidoreductase [Methylovirgula sp. HY1]|uniref:NAD(P)/FAD-dependent oxidoreductase n=1 Tax=Methylovirgula sp. HY1 TaxID=2822761 RepID=UPI001C5BC3BC|nr:FAD-dependent oxidoreductase [Methylovirgula sp. HY1]QXX75604.1 Rhodocoxin reductase [Methylovirgula sp. HY1]
MSEDKGVVIIGAGHGGVQLAASLREEGYQDKIVLLGDEKDPPYQRPPLSKAYMKHETPEDGVILRGPDFYPQQKIDLMLGERVVEIDRAARRLTCASGTRLEYSKLVFATGGVMRQLRIDGADLTNVFSLRTLAEARTMRDCFDHSKNVVIIGAGFIGLEFAATAAAKGCAVNVIELATRPMARAVTEQTSAFFAAEHKKLGVVINFATSVTAIKGEAGRVKEVVLTDGRVLPADLVLIGIGLVPSDELAKAAGLECPNGIKVDDKQVTSDENIFAIGDAAYHFNPFAKRWMRLESVQNATDQARVLAKHLTGKPAHYESVPWFWSDQADLKLQMVGFLDDCDRIIMRGSLEERAYSLFGFKEGKLAGVESVNKAGDHMLARRLIGENISISPEMVADPNSDLKSLLRGVRR